METYLDRIKKVKNEQRLTNDQLAERSGIPLGTLSKILAGMSDSPKLSNTHGNEHVAYLFELVAVLLIPSVDNILAHL